MCNFYLLDYFEAKCKKVEESEELKKLRRFPVLNQDSEQRLQPYYVSVEENFGIELQNESDENVQPLRIPIGEIDWPRLA